MQVEAAMLAISEQIPRLVCSLVRNESTGKKLLGVLISDLVAARVPPDLRRNFSAYAFEAARTPDAVLFYLRLVDGSVGGDAEAEDESIELQGGDDEAGGEIDLLTDGSSMSQG